MSVFHATILFQYASNNRQTANLGLPLKWQMKTFTRREKIAEIRTLCIAYRHEPDCPALPDNLQGLSEEKLDELALELIRLLVKVFNRKPKSATKAKK